MNSFDVNGLYISSVDVLSRRSDQYWLSGTGGLSYSFEAPAETEVVIHGMTRNTEILGAILNLMRTPLTALRTVEEEFFCVYCNSINPMTHRHCSQCGAPRGFLIGHPHP